MPAWDYIIVGGGAAGCVLANRLSESGAHRVLLLEAGGSDRRLWIKVPAGFTKTINDPSLNWSYVNEPSPQTANRAIVCPRGRVIGGSSSINGHLYVRGQAQDYDDWVQAGAVGWSWQDLLPYFKRAESGEISHLPGRGSNGPLKVSLPRLQHPLCEAFIQAAAGIGIERNPDYNSGDQLGTGYYQYLMKNGRRWSAADAYLRPAMSRPNLTVMQRCQATGLILRGRRVVGVHALLAGRSVRLIAQCEVLLAAGSIGSPHLLQVSGIGAELALRRLGIQPVHHLPGVGANLIDHYIVRVSCRVRGARTLNEDSRGLALAGQVLSYAWQRRGLLSSAVAHAHGFVRSEPGLVRPDLQWLFAPASYPAGRMGRAQLESEPGMTCGLSQLRPFSRGIVAARSADPLQAPIIQPNYLADERDLRLFRVGLKQVRELFASPPLARYVDHETWPAGNPAYTNDEERFIRETGSTVYHPVGSCAMGESPDSVVDPQLRVHGLTGLRIIDASVMPSMVSGNTYATTIAIAEKGSDLVLAAHQAAMRSPADSLRGATRQPLDSATENIHA